jgi:hypothetical protein
MILLKLAISVVLAVVALWACAVLSYDHLPKRLLDVVRNVCETALYAGLLCCAVLGLFALWM